MTWMRLDDGFDTHPKVLSLVNKGDPLNVWVRLLAWAGRQRERDGRVPRVVGLAYGTPKALARLVEVGLYDVTPDGWAIHDFEEYAAKGPSAGDPSDLSRKRAEAGRKGGIASGQARLQASDDPDGEESRVRIRARNLLNLAVKSGKVRIEPCAICRETPTEAHHSDYTKPLDVEWLCKRHHDERHAEQTKQLLRDQRSNAEEATEAIASVRAGAPAPARAPVPIPSRPDPDVYDVAPAPSADRTPWVPPPDPDAPKPVEEAVEIAGKHGIDRGTVATCLPRWRGQRRAFPTAMAFVAAHAPKGFGAGYVVAAFRELDPDLVDGWDHAGRPAPSAPPKTPEKAPVRFDLGLDEPTPPPRKPRQPPPPPLRRVGDAADGSQGVQGPADAPAGLRAAGGAT